MCFGATSTVIARRPGAHIAERLLMVDVRIGDIVLVNIGCHSNSYAYTA